MKTFFVLLAFLSPALAWSADNILCSPNGSSCQLIDNSGNHWNAKIGFTTDGNGDIFTLGDVASTDNILGQNPSGNRTLIDNLSRRWSASVLYTTDGSGNVIPISAGGGGGGVSAVTGTAPVVSSGGSTPAISMAAATNSVNGYLTSADHTTFAAKQAALSFTAPLSDTSNTVSCAVASGSQAGCLASSDWTTFNGKQAAGNYMTALTGDGTAAGPGSATLTLANTAVTAGSYDAANLTVDSKGRLTAASAGSPYQGAQSAEYNVLTSYTGGGSNGTLARPYTTVQAAINAAITNNYVNSIVIMHDSSTENITINNSTSGLSLVAAKVSTIDSQRIELNGSITISGTTTRFKVKNIEVALPGGASPDMVDTATGGRNYFDNVAFQGGGGISYSGSWARWHEFSDCTISGPVSIAGTPAANSSISTWRVRGGANYTVNATNATLALYDNFSVGNVIQTAGKLTIDGGRGFVAGSAISSTTNGASDLLTIQNVSLETGSGTWDQITKSGSAPYIFSNVIRNEAGDSITGTRVNYGATATDFAYVPATSTNWSPVPANIGGALDQLGANIHTPKITVQGAGITPSCAGGNAGTIYFTSLYVLCVCNGTGFVETADGSTACTF